MLKSISRSYLNKILQTEPANLIGLWAQDEGSGSISYDQSPQKNNGAYTGVTLGQPGVPGMGITSPYYDGVNDYNTIYSAGLAADFNGAEGTCLQWVKVNAAAVWTDGTQRATVRLRVDGSNLIQLYKMNNTFWWVYIAGGTQEAVAKSSLSETGWMCIGLTWSAADDEVIAYYNGVQEGTPQTSLGTWAGSLVAAVTLIGGLTTTPSGPWHGLLGPAALWKTPLTAAQIATLSTV